MISRKLNFLTDRMHHFFVKLTVKAGAGTNIPITQATKEVTAFKNAADKRIPNAEDYK